MDRTRRWRNVFLAMLLASPLLLLAAGAAPAGLGGGFARAALIALGLSALLFGAIFAWHFHAKLRLRRALARGEDLLARWTVDPRDWATFLAHEGQASGAHGANELALPDPVPADGVPVLVGADAVQVGDSLHSLPLRGAPEVLAAELQDPVHALPIIELRLKHPGYYQRSTGTITPPTFSVLRFPVPNTAWREARKVVAHYNRDTPGKADFFHGRGDGSDPEDLSRCPGCGFETYKYRSQCERCGTPLLSRRWSRRFGAILVLCGLFLSGMMGVLLWWLAPMLLHPGVNYGGSRFDGSPAQALGVGAVLLAVMAFGLATLCYGAWQMATGQRSLRVAGVASAFLTGFLVLAALLGR